MRAAPLRVAWLGHRSSQLGGGMATYSNEIVGRLRRRGIKVTFFHHDLKDAAPDLKLAARLKYTPVLPAQEMEEPDLLRFLQDTRAH